MTLRRCAWMPLLWLAAAATLSTAPAIVLPNAADSVKFAVIGDNGTGSREQLEVAEQMNRVREAFAFDLVLMLGDNFYGSQGPADLEKKFAMPYRPLLQAGVVFQAALGNHDDLATIDYPPLNMAGRRYYTYTRKHVRFLVLDTNVMDRAQRQWADATLAASPEPWKLAYFHHPIYGNAGRHGSAVDLRVLIEPLLLKHGVQVVFSGHDHVYERLHPQKGIHYFVSGAGGQLRKGDLRRSDATAAGFDQDQSFMVVEVGADDLDFQVVSRSGATVDSGRIRRNSGRIGTY